MAMPLFFKNGTAVVLVLHFQIPWKSPLCMTAHTHLCRYIFSHARECKDPFFPADVSCFNIPKPLTGQV